MFEEKSSSSSLLLSSLSCSSSSSPFRCPDQDSQQASAGVSVSLNLFRSRRSLSDTSSCTTPGRGLQGRTTWRMSLTTLSTPSLAPGQVVAIELQSSQVHEREADELICPASPVETLHLEGCQLLGRWWRLTFSLSGSSLCRHLQVKFSLHMGQ